VQKTCRENLQLVINSRENKEKLLYLIFLLRHAKFGDNSSVYRENCRFVPNLFDFEKIVLNKLVMQFSDINHKFNHDENLQVNCILGYQPQLYN
jgi:hypothetical protein